MPPPRPRCNFIHPKKLSPFPERLELPFPSEEILSGCEDVASSKDQYTTWVKTDPDVTLERHMFDVQKAVAEFREASAERHDTFSHEYSFDKQRVQSFACAKTTQHPQLESRTTWKRRRLEQIAGKWHVITLQEALNMLTMIF